MSTLGYSSVKAKADIAVCPMGDGDFQDYILIAPIIKSMNSL